MNVLVKGTERGTSTGPRGRFALGPLPPGEYVLQARFVGYAPQTQDVRVPAGDTARVRFALVPRTVGLEAVVRGLRETQVGVYVDGMRTFPAGPARIGYEYASGQGLVRSIEARAYGYQTLHTMNNEGKVTFDSKGFPGPPLRVAVNAEIQTVGGRVATELASTPKLRLTLGGDAYRAYRDAERPFQVVMDGTPMVPGFYESEQIWPGVSIADAGVFAQATRLFGSVEATGTVRTDFVWAGAEEKQVTGVYLDIAEAGAGSLDASALD